MHKLLKNMHVSKSILNVCSIYKTEKIHIFDEDFNCSIFYIGFDQNHKRYLLQAEQATAYQYNSYVFPIKDDSYLFFSRQNLKEMLHLTLIINRHDWYGSLKYNCINPNQKYIRKVTYTDDVNLDLFIIYAARYIKYVVSICELSKLINKCINVVNSMELLKKID